jgi:hypothetical protein
MTTGSSWNGHWQASGPAGDRLRPSSAACWSHVSPTQTLHTAAAARAPIGVFPRTPPLPVSWAGGPRPIRARVRHLGARFRWSSTCTATDSGAVSAGSNPAGGTGQRHKFEHSDNLDLPGFQRGDLRKRGTVPDLSPEPPPRQDPPNGKPSSAAKRNDGQQAVAPAGDRCSFVSVRGARRPPFTSCSHVSGLAWCHESAGRGRRDAHRGPAETGAL